MQIAVDSRIGSLDRAEQGHRSQPALNTSQVFSYIEMDYNH